MKARRIVPPLVAALAVVVALLAWELPGLVERRMNRVLRPGPYRVSLPAGQWLGHPVPHPNL